MKNVLGKIFGKTKSAKSVRVAFVAAALIFALTVLLSIQTLQAYTKNEQTVISNTENMQAEQVADETSESIQWLIDENGVGKLRTNDGDGVITDIVIGNGNTDGGSIKPAVEIVDEKSGHKIFIDCSGEELATTYYNEAKATPSAAAISDNSNTRYEETVVLDPIEVIVVPNEKNVWQKIAEDFNNFDINNDDINKVKNAHYFSGFRGQFVLFLEGYGRSASFGKLMIIYSSSKGSTNTILHEHGHYLQYKQLGFFKYLIGIGLPSWQNTPVDYYSQPWEVTADILGGVPVVRYSEGADTVGWNYLAELKSKSLETVINEYRINR